MTRLFNLESYPNCCQDAQLFEKSIEDLSPKENTLPLNYKRFLANYQRYPYLPQPLFADELPHSLTFNSHPPSPQHLGEEVRDGEDKKLFIIPDTIDLMTLSSGGIFDFNESYLYRSAYLYWNYVSQLPQVSESQRLVLIDLDSFHPQQLLPLRLESHFNSNYPIPILDQQSDFPLEISEKVKSSYDRIIEAVSHYLLKTHFPQLVENQSAIAHLYYYLKKQAFLQQLSRFNSDSPLQILLEINTGRNISYKTVTVSPDEIRNIVTETVNLSDLEKLSNCHQDYSFFIVSHWNNFLYPRNSNLVCINPNESQFSEILEAKTRQEFPLFGITLDRIEYKVKIGNEEKWIQLTDSNNNISYEGKPQTLQGVIPETQQNEFSISQTESNHLPIQVNGKDYLINGKPQDYVIEVITPQREENIKITFDFQITPGKTPKLNVNSLYSNDKIKSYLTDRTTQTKTIIYYCVPSREIRKNREEKSNSQIQQLKNDSRLTNVKRNIQQISTQGSATKLADLLKSISQNMGKDKTTTLELFQYINPDTDDSLIREINELIKNRVTPLSYLIQQEAPVNSYSFNEMTRENKQRLTRSIIFVGKLYAFSKHLDLNHFLNPHVICTSQTIRESNYHNEYLQFLARTAVKPEYQEKYFKLFHEYYFQEKSRYLWGYGRILLWYYCFSQADYPVINYCNHFIKLSHYLLSKRANNFNNQYRQDAFLSLIYLLTFSEKDSTFLTENSEERRLAKQVVSHYENEQIILRQVSTEKSLNEIFADLIAGNATEEEVRKIIEAT